MNYLSVCAGIEAASVAWRPLGWTPVAFAEVEKFPSAVLAHHYPHVPNWGDMTKFQEWPDADIDVLVGGTPCQSFSVAGLRRGLADPRGNLMLTYLAILDKYRPTWMVWENVPGILSSNKGRDFGCFLGALGELGYGWAYRSLDAQYFHLAQRRERVFVVGCLRGWECAAQVLFEPESMSGYTPPSREARQDVAPTLSARTKGGDGRGTDFDCDGGLIAFGGNNTAGPIDIATAVNACGSASGRMDFESETFIAAPLRSSNHHADQVGYESHLITHALRADGFDASEDGTGRGTPLVPVAIQERATCENPNAGPNGAGFKQDGLAYTLEARSVPQAVAFDTTQITSATNRSNPQPDDPCHPLAARAHAPAIAYRTAGDGCAYEEGDTTAPLTTATDPSVNVVLKDSHASAQETNAGEILRELRKETGEEAFTVWGIGVLDLLRQEKVLQLEMLRSGGRKTDNHGRCELDQVAREGAEDLPTWAMRQVREEESFRRTPQGRELAEQFSRKFGESLQILPQQDSPETYFLRCMWAASEGLGLLREALSKIQDAWQPLGCEGEPASPRWAVRRLTPREAARLQGFPDDYLDITYPGKPAADGPKYKALGNSMAVPVMRWIGERIAAVNLEVTK